MGQYARESAFRGMIWIILVVAVATDASKSRTVGRHDFSPRMDYDEWKPLGRGDPLKNDPTYDYMPPVLDRVHYWVDPDKRTPDPPIPISNVMTEPAPTLTPATSRLGTFTLFDPLLKLMGQTKTIIGAGLNNIRTPATSAHYPHTHFTPAVHGVPKLNTVDYMPPPPPPQPAPQKIQALQRPPYTMLMPPPLPPSVYLTTTSDPVTSFGTSTQTTEVTLLPLIAPTTEKASSGTKDDEITTSTVDSPAAYMVTTVLGNSENLYKPVAITMPESISNETSEELYSQVSTTPTSAGFPLYSLFNEDTNHLQDDEVKPNVHPPADDYYGFLPTTVRTTTTVQALTTDPMFKHYKQPSKPAMGPFYLIIQGHSKVKTYGASKNNLSPLSMNEIHLDDRKRDNYEDYGAGKYRRDRKLRIQNEEVIQGHPIVDLGATYHAKKGAGFEVSDNVERPINSVGVENDTLTLSRFATRRLLATVTKTPDKLDQDQLGLESLIALNDDYNSEDVINLLLKQDGPGSGFGGFVSSLFGKSLSSNDEI